jgi:hypothetical protein
MFSWTVNSICTQEDTFENSEAFLDKLSIITCLKGVCILLHVSLAVRTTHGIKSRAQPTRCAPPALELGEG